MRAIEQGTSLSAKVRGFLQDHLNDSPAGLAEQLAQAAARLMAAMDCRRAVRARGDHRAGSACAPAHAAQNTVRRRLPRP
jgi:hypothetical protein